MLGKIFELKAKYNAEIEKLMLKVEVLDDLIELAQDEPVDVNEENSEEVIEEQEVVDELENV